MKKNIFSLAYPLLLGLSYLPLFDIGRSFRLFDILALFHLIALYQKRRLTLSPALMIIVAIPFLFFLFRGGLYAGTSPIFYPFRVLELCLMYKYIAVNYTPPGLARLVKQLFVIYSLMFPLYLARPFLAGLIPLLPAPQEYSQTLCFVSAVITLTALLAPCHPRALAPFNSIIFSSLIVLCTSLIMGTVKSYIAICLILLFLLVVKFAALYLYNTILVGSKATLVISVVLISVIALSLSFVDLSSLYSALTSITVRLDGAINVFNAFAHLAYSSTPLSSISDLQECLSNKFVYDSVYDASFLRKSTRYICQTRYLLSNPLNILGVGLGSYPSAASESMFLRTLIELGPFILSYILFSLYRLSGLIPVMAFLMLSFFNDLWYTCITTAFVIVLLCYQRPRANA